MRWARLIGVLAVGVLAVFGAGCMVVLGMFLLLGPTEAERPPALPARLAAAVKSSPPPQTPEGLYLDLLKQTLTRAHVASVPEPHPFAPSRAVFQWLYPVLERPLSRRGLEIVRLLPSDPRADAETMINTTQLDNIQFCVTDVLRRKVPGDVIEAGAWRGGATIFMRAVLKAYADKERSVWVADSFEGFPEPDAQANDPAFKQGGLAVSLEEVKRNFARYGLLDEKVRFLKGFFNKTLPGAPIEKLSVLRADADLYESTRDVLENLYPKLSVGGYAIFDDYFSIAPCRKAIDEFRTAHNITEKIKVIDGDAVYWLKEK